MCAETAAMSQQAFFSTAGSETIGQPQILDADIGSVPVVTSVEFQGESAPSVLYQSTGTPTFYTTTGSPFHGTGTFLPTLSGDDRKEYLTVVPTGVHLSTSSGLLPSNASTSMASTSSQQDATTSVTQLTPLALSHVQLTPIQVTQEVDVGDHQIIYEQYYVDQQDPSASAVLDEERNLQLASNGGEQLIHDEKYGVPVKEASAETCSLVSSDVSSQSSAQAKRLKQAEAARQRYQRMSVEERKEINARRTLAQKRKRQRDKEIEELEGLLRESNDILDDPAINEQLREKRIRARRAEAARQRYQRMSSEERRIYNHKRRMRQLGLQGTKKSAMDDEKLRQHIIEQNAKKAEAARLRYHRMTDEEKRLYNQRRTEAFRRRRIEEEILLSTPAGRISAEALNKAQQIMLRNARRAEAARLRYQRMTPEQRKAYNQKRSSAKKAREHAMHAANSSSVPLTCTGGNANESKGQVEKRSEVRDGNGVTTSSNLSEEALSALERDVVKRTRQANMVLLRQKRNNNMHEQLVMVTTAPDGTQTVIPATTMEDGKQVFHIPTVASQHSLEDGSSVTAVGASQKQHISQQHPVQLTAIPIVAVPEQVATDQANIQPETQLVAVAAQPPQIMIPQLAELHTMQPSPIDVDDSQQIQQNSSAEQPQQQQQHLIVTVQEPQQAVQHQIIVTDLNQPTGAVLTSMSNHGRSRGRPPVYAAAAAAIQQQQQQGGVMLVQSSQRGVTTGSPQTRTVCVDASGKRRGNQRQGSSQQHVIPASVEGQDILAVATAASVGTSVVPPTSELTPQQKLDMQRAKRAERARLRYHSMSELERRIFNARRADALRKARMRDEQLCQLAESAVLAGAGLDEATMAQVEEAQRRRAKRAEAARLKYHRMSSEERRQYNAMRDAQRRQRKREQEAAALLARQQQQNAEEEAQEEASHNQEDASDQSLMYESYIRYDEPLGQSWTE